MDLDTFIARLQEVQEAHGNIRVYVNDNLDYFVISDMAVDSDNDLVMWVSPG